MCFIFSSYMDGCLSYFCVSGIVINAAINMAMQTSLEHSDDSSFGYRAQIGIAGSQDSFVF